MSMRAICPIILFFCNNYIIEDNVFCMYSRMNLAAKSCQGEQNEQYFSHSSFTDRIES